MDSEANLYKLFKLDKNHVLHILLVCSTTVKVTISQQIVFQNGQNAISHNQPQLDLDPEWLVFSSFFIMFI